MEPFRLSVYTLDQHYQRNLIWNDLKFYWVVFWTLSQISNLSSLNLFHTFQKILTINNFFLLENFLSLKSWKRMKSSITNTKKLLIVQRLSRLTVSFTFSQKYLYFFKFNLNLLFSAVYWTDFVLEKLNAFQKKNCCFFSQTTEN